MSFLHSKLEPAGRRPLFGSRAPRAGQAAALVSALGGLDGLVFTAGIGENSTAIRAAICARLEWLGLRLDKAANAAGATRISAPDSAVEVLVIATDEEAMIARHTQTATEQDAA